MWLLRWFYCLTLYGIHIQFGSGSENEMGKYIQRHREQWREQFLLSTWLVEVKEIQFLQGNMQSLKTYLMNTFFVQGTMVGEVRAQRWAKCCSFPRNSYKKKKLRNSLFSLHVLLTESYTGPPFLKPLECISNGKRMRPMREIFLEDTSSASQILGCRWRCTLECNPVFTLPQPEPFFAQIITPKSFG